MRLMGAGGTPIDMRLQTLGICYTTSAECGIMWYIIEWIPIRKELAVTADPGQSKRRRKQ
jgi:hypothetical protein